MFIDNAVSDNIASNFLQLAYDVWNAMMDACYKTLKVNPLKWGSESGSSLLSQVTTVRIESVIAAVATGLLILVFVVGVLREGGHIISEKSQPYGVISLMLRFFVCAALIGGYMKIASTIFDIFTAAIKGIGIGSTHGYGLSDPSKPVGTYGITQGIKDFLLGLFSPLTGSQLVTTMMKSGFLNLIGLVYMFIVIACAFVVFFKVYGRYFKIIVAITLAPIGLALYGSPMTEQQAKKFVFYLIKLGAEGLIMYLVLILYDRFIPIADQLVPGLFKDLTSHVGSDKEFQAYLAYIITQIFFCILLVSLISASEKIAEELL